MPDSKSVEKLQWVYFLIPFVLMGPVVLPSLGIPAKRYSQFHHTMKSFGRKRSATVVSTCWATVDWFWHKEWNLCVQSNFHFVKERKKKKKKKACRQWMNGRTFPPNYHRWGKSHHHCEIICKTVHTVVSLGNTALVAQILSQPEFLARYLESALTKCIGATF